MANNNAGLGLDDLIANIAGNLSIDLPDQTLPEPDFVNYWQLLQDRKVYLDFEITPASVMGLHRQILMLNMQDKDIPVEERKPLIVYIMSPGGDLDAMYMMTDAFAMSKTPIYTVNVGIAASAAALVFMGGHKRFMTPTAKVLIHEGSAKLEGDAGKIMDATDTYKQELKQMKDYIMSRTRVPKNLLNKKRSNDWTLTAQECLDFGICDKIIESWDEVL